MSTYRAVLYTMCLDAFSRGVLKGVLRTFLCLNEPKTEHKWPCMRPINGHVSGEDVHGRCVGASGPSVVSPNASADAAACGVDAKHAQREAHFVNKGVNQASSSKCS